MSNQRVVVCSIFKTKMWQNLYHPLLPVRMHDKLLFPLCRMCCEEMIQEDCPHQFPNDRILRGTWVSEEVKETVKLGYRIQRICEIWQYEMTQYNQKERKGGIFAEYMNEFFAQKTMASVFPPNCLTEQDKNEYVKELEFNEGIILNKDAIQHNVGLR